MKNILIYLSLAFSIISKVSAQNTVLNRSYTSVKQFDLDNVVIKSYKPKEYSNKVKERNILLVLTALKTAFTTVGILLISSQDFLCRMTCR